MTEAILHQGRVGQRRAGVESLFLGLNKRNEIIEGALGDAQGHRADVEREDRQRDGEQWAWNRGLAEENVDGLIRRDKVICHRDIMATRSPQSRRFPGVDNLDLVGGQEHTLEFRRVRKRTRPRLAVFGDDAVAE